MIERLLLRMCDITFSLVVAGVLYVGCANQVNAQTIPAGPYGSINQWGPAGVSQVLTPGLAGYCLTSGGVGQPISWNLCPGATLASLPTIATNQFYGNVSGAQAAPVGLDVNAILNTIGYDIARPPSAYSIIYKSGTAPNNNWQTLPPGAAGRVLQTFGTSSPPAWVPAASANLNTICTTAGAILYYDPVLSWTCLLPGTTGQVLQTNGAAAPSWITYGNFSGTLTVTPPAGTVTPGLVVNQTGPTSGTTAGPVTMNKVSGSFGAGTTGSGKTFNLDNGSVVGVMNAWAVGGANYNLTGEFYGAVNQVNVLTTGGTTSENIASSSQAYANVTSNAFLWGSTSAAVTDSGGTVSSQGGLAVESGIWGTGTVSNNRYGLSIYNTGSKPATAGDYAINIATIGPNATSGGAFKKLMNISSIGGSSLASSADMFFADTAFTVANIFNLPNATVTGDIFNFPNLVATGDGHVAIGTATPTTGTQILNVTAPSSGSTQTVASTNSITGADGHQISDSASGTSLFVGVGEAANTGTFLGLSQGSAGIVKSFGASAPWLLVGTNTNVPLVLGTNNTARLSFSGAGAVTLNLGSDAQGDMYYRNASNNLARLPVGTSTQLLGGGTIPAWVSTGTGVLTALAVNVGTAGSFIVAPSTPQGRLTLTANTPVMTASATAQTTLRYDCYAGNGVPFFNGTIDQADTITSCEVTDAMVSAASAGQVVANNVYDVWWVHGGANRICLAMSAAVGGGGGWSSDTGGSNTARGTGYTQLDRVTRGYITNKNSITNCFNGATNYGPVSANQGTFLGTVYASANGQISFTFGGSASGGSAALFGVWNMYNRTTVGTAVIDNGTNYTYTLATIRQSRASAGNQIQFVLGLQEDSPQFSYAAQGGSVAAASASAAWCIGYDTTSACSVSKAVFVSQAAVSGSWGLMTGGNWPLTTNALGFHTVTANEQSDGTNANTFDSATNNTLSGHLPM